MWERKEMVLTTKSLQSTNRYFWFNRQMAAQCHTTVAALVAVSVRVPAPLGRDVVSLTDADDAGLELLRRCVDADDVLKSIAGGSGTVAVVAPPDDEARPLLLDSPARGDRPWSADLPSRGAGAGGDERPLDWFGLQVRWCVSQWRCWQNVPQ